MKKRFIYHDEKSNKFWWIDYEGDSLAVNYGKVGSIGKFQTKEFDNEEQCLKEASKLIAAKMKKGYQEAPNFNFMDRYYFDDEEIGLHVKTSHPNFQCHFTDPLYMCCWDEESPFGSDEGADALNVLENSLRKEPDLDCADFPQMLIETMWGMKYIAMDSILEEDVRAQLLADEMSSIQSNMITYATAFGQIKVMGKISHKLKKMGLNALARHQLTAKILQWGDGQDSPILQKMIDDLTAFPHEN